MKKSLKKFIMILFVLVFVISMYIVTSPTVTIKVSKTPWLDYLPPSPPEAEVTYYKVRRGDLVSFNGIVNFKIWIFSVKENEVRFISSLVMRDKDNDWRESFLYKVTSEDSVYFSSPTVSSGESYLIELTSNYEKDK